MDKSSLKQALADLSKLYNEGRTNYNTEADAWWDKLAYEDKLLAFYSVVKRIHDGDIKQQGSYRYVLYDVFGFGPDAYALGMDCGYMTLHNAIKTDEEEQILLNYRAKNKCVNTDCEKQ